MFSTIGGTTTGKATRTSSPVAISPISNLFTAFRIMGILPHLIWVFQLDAAGRRVYDKDGII